MKFQVAKSGKPLKVAHDIAFEASGKGKNIATFREKPQEELWADEGIEQLAGKGWKEIEADRHTQKMQEINARVQEAFKTSHVRMLMLKKL